MLPNTVRTGEGQSAPARQPSLFPTSQTAYGIDLDNHGNQPAVLAADPCAGRHRGAESSALANTSILPHKRETHERILAIVQARGDAGATVHELADVMNTTPNCVSGRLTELRTLGRLAYKLDAGGTKVKRRGACVLVEAGTPGP